MEPDHKDNENKKAEEKCGSGDLHGQNLKNVQFGRLSAVLGENKITPKGEERNQLEEAADGQNALNPRRPCL